MKTFKQRKRIRKQRKQEHARTKRWFKMRRARGPLITVRYTWRVIYDESQAMEFK